MSAPADKPDRLRPEFWRLPLGRLTDAEWEALCDGCGKCCVLKLEDEDTGGVYYTDVACRLFDPETCRCGNYELRQRLVTGCVALSKANIADVAQWMPRSCAYRLRHEGRPLPDWHPLLTGDPESVVRAGHSMRGRTVPEWEVEEEDLEDRVLWEGL